MQRDEALDVAQRCADYVLARNPYVRMIAVSGSLARTEHKGDHEDADFFVVAEPGRLWEAFLGCVWHGWRFSRQHGLPRTFFCFNYLVDDSHPEEIDLRRAEYAREFLRLRVLAGADVYLRLLKRFEKRLGEAAPELVTKATMNGKLDVDENPISPSRFSDTKNPNQ